MMKKNLLLSFLVVACFTILNCGDTKNNSVDANGNCTDSLINDWNNMNTANRKVLDSRTVGDRVASMRSYAAQCDSFFANHTASVTCKALDQKTFEKVTADTSVEKTKCDTNKKNLADYDAAKAEQAAEAAREAARRSNTSPTQPLAPSGERSTVVASIPKGSLILTVVDRYDVMKLLSSGQSLVLQNGRIKSENDIELGSTYCMVQATSRPGDSTVSQDEDLTAVFTNEKVQTTGVDIAILFADKSYAVGCHKFGSSLFTVGNLIDGVSPVFKVNIDSK